MNIESFGLVAMYEPALRDLWTAILSGTKPEERAGVHQDRLLAKWLDAQVMDNGLGVISISGSLGYGWWGPTYQGIAAEIEAMEANENVSAILMDINSPGGVVSGVIELSKIIGKCQKPVYAYCEGMCASAAYLLASTAKKVYTTAQTAIGSIGVMAVYFNDSKLMDRMGVEEIIFRSKNAQNKNLDPKSAEGKAQVQKSIDEIEVLFIAQLANNRGVSTEDVIAKFGQGLTFHAQEALEKGMVDEIVSDFDDCVAKIMPSQVGGGGVVMGENAVAITIETLRAQHPDLVSQLTEEGRVLGFEAGKAEGATVERNRIVALDALKNLEFGAEVVREAIANGETVDQAKSKIVDKLMESAKSGGTVKPVTKVTLAELAGETDGAGVNPVEPVVEVSEVDVAAAKAIAAIESARKARKKE